MRNWRYFLIAIAIMVTASCSWEIPKEVRIDSAQLNIEGQTASMVHADTSAIVLVRDSVADEKSGLYRVETCVTLILDSIYSTDQLTDTLSLKLQSADGDLLGTLQLADSLTTDSLIAFLGKAVGGTQLIPFKGQMSGKSIVKLQEGGKMSFTGFSFLFADPQVNKKLNEYRKLLDAFLQVGKEAQQNASRNPFAGYIYAMVLGQMLQKAEAIDKQLLNLQSKMTPLQRERYNAYHKELMSYSTRRR